MSLDVYLSNVVKCKCGEVHILETRSWERNITHNVGRIAARVSIGNGFTLYQLLWHPEEVFDKHYLPANEMLVLLILGLRGLIDNKTELEKLNPENGWGSHQGLCEFVNAYIEACTMYPDAAVSTST